MANYCTKCGTQIILMTGRIYLSPDEEPYKSGKHEKTNIDVIDRHIIAHFCENCDEIVNTFNE